MMTPRVLVVQDETELLAHYEKSLSADGFEMVSAKTSRDAFGKTLEVRPDAILVDVSLADVSALTKRLKTDPRTTHIPVILVLPARKAARAKAASIKQVADDYIIEPSSRLLLKARIHSVLRRAKVPDAAREILGTLGLRLDVQARTVTVKGRKLRLTRKEFDLLVLFLMSDGRVLSIRKLLEEVWGYDSAQYSDPRTVQTHISSLRRKLGPVVAKRITSISGIGYRFD